MLAQILDMADSERSKTMQRTGNLAVTAMFLAALLASFSFVRSARAQAQRPAFFGTFTLPYHARWGGSVLSPGKYSVTIKSTGSPMIALIRTAEGNAVTYVMNGSVSTPFNHTKTCLLRENKG